MLRRVGKIREEINNSDISVNVCYRFPSENEDLDDVVLAQITKYSKRRCML